MAINYLNSIDLNRNELQNAQLIKAQVENQPNDASAGTGLEGQLYYDTTLDVLKVWAGGAWSEVGGGVETLTTTDGTYIDLTPNSATAGAVTVTADLSAADGTASAASRFLTKDNTWATVPQGDITALTEGTYINIDNPGGPIPTINHDLTTRTDSATAETLTYGGTFTAYTNVTTNATGHVTDIEETVFTMPASDDTKYDLATAATGTAIVLTGSDATTDSVTISGEGSEIEVTRESASELRIGLPNDVTIADTLTVNGDFIVNQDAFFYGSGVEIANGTIIDMGGNRVRAVADPTAAQDAATKQYVDDSVAGGLIYQGEYNAATNTPNLDSPPTGTINRGFTYTVTADGLFFTEQVRVGDVLIAEIDTPTTLADWTTVQNNVDLADLTTVGIGNVNAGTGIDVSYTSGTATVSLTAVAARSGSIAVPTSTTYTYPNNITAGSTNDVLIQLVDSTTGETVYADVTRLTETTFSVDYGVTEPTDVIALIQLIG